jgi:hypothetical protein
MIGYRDLTIGVNFTGLNTTQEKFDEMGINLVLIQVCFKVKKIQPNYYPSCKVVLLY